MQVKTVEKYKVGDKVKAKATRNTPFGAFVTFDGLDGLVHKTKMGGREIEVGSEYDFYIVSIEPELHKLNLSMDEAGSEEVSKEESNAKPAKKAKATKKTAKAKTKKSK